MSSSSGIIVTFYSLDFLAKNRDRISHRDSIFQAQGFLRCVSLLYRLCVIFFDLLPFYRNYFICFLLAYSFSEKPDVNGCAV